MHVINADAGGIVARMRRIDPNLHLRYSEAGECYIVYWVSPETRQEELVATYQELDQRIAADLERLEHMQRQPGYSYADELDKKDAQAEKDGNDAHKEAMAASAEKLHYALRKDKNMLGQRVFIPNGLKE